MKMEILTNMAGNVWKVVVKPGDQVSEGQDVVILKFSVDGNTGSTFRGKRYCR